MLFSFLYSFRELLLLQMLPPFAFEGRSDRHLNTHCATVTLFGVAQIILRYARSTKGRH